MTSVLPSRPPVPSERQVELGHATDRVVDVVQRAEPEVAKENRQGRVKRFVRDLDPRVATAGYPTQPVFAFCANALLQGLAAQAISANFFRIGDATGVDNKGLIALGGWTIIVAAATGPIVGYLADRVKRVYLAAAGALLFALGTIVLGVWASLAAFLVARTAQQLFGLAWGNVTTLPLLSDYYPPDIRGRIFAIPQSIGSMGGIVGPIIGGALGSIFGWQPAVLITGVLALGGVIGFLFLREPARGRWDRLQLGASEEVADHEEPPPSFGESWRAARAVRTLRRMWYAEALVSIGGVGATPILLAIQRSQSGGGNALMLGLLIGGIQVGLTAGLFIGGTLVDVLVRDAPARIMVTLGWMMLANLALLVAVGLLHNPFLVIPILVFQAFANGLLQTSRDVLISLVVPARLRAFGLQTKALWGTAGLLAIPLAISFTSNPITGFLILAVPLVTAGAVLYITATVDVAKDIEAARNAVLAAEEMAASRREGGAGKLLVCRKVDVHYDTVQVLFGVDFDIEKGELVALLGTNGAGKSTLLRAICGLSQSTGGAIFLNGKDVTHSPAFEQARNAVVYMPGGKSAFPTMTVADNLRSALWTSSRDDDAPQRLARVHELFPILQERASQLAGSLSGGEQQMLGLAMAFLMCPTLLLIDELSLGLAPAVVEELLSAVEAIHEQGTTIVVVEQSVNLALSLAKRAVFMEKGEVRFVGDTAELRRRPDILRSVYLRGTRSGDPMTRRASTTRPGDRTVLETRDITVAYGGITAVRNVSLTVQAGEIVGLIGPNGAGKTTLFDAITGFAPLQAGTIALSGTDITTLRPDERAKRGLARSFQDARLFPSMTVIDNVHVAMERHAKTSPVFVRAFLTPRARGADKRLRLRTESVLDVLGLSRFRDFTVGELSTGTRRIVDLACVMATNPDVLLLDEPSSGIAQAEAEELGPLLERIRHDLGCALVVIEHDMRLLTSIADRLIGMVRGEIVVEGSADAVTTHPVLVEAYLGSSERALARSGDVASSPSTRSST